MPPSFVFTASAWFSCGPGAAGSWNGNAVAGTGAVEAVEPDDGTGALDAGAGDDVVGLLADVLDPLWRCGAWRGSGAVGLRITTGFWPWPPLITKSAGCCLVAPPCG